MNVTAPPSAAWADTLLQSFARAGYVHAEPDILQRPKLHGYGREVLEEWQRLVDCQLEDVRDQVVGARVERGDPGRGRLAVLARGVRQLVLDRVDLVEDEDGVGQVEVAGHPLVALAEGLGGVDDQAHDVDVADRASVHALVEAATSLGSVVGVIEVADAHPEQLVPTVAGERAEPVVDRHRL